MCMSIMNCCFPVSFGRNRLGADCVETEYHRIAIATCLSFLNLLSPALLRVLFSFAIIAHSYLSCYRLNHEKYNKRHRY